MAPPNPNQNQFQGSMVDPNTMQGQSAPQMQSPGLVGYGMAGQSEQFNNLTGMYAVGAVAAGATMFGMGSQFLGFGASDAITSMSGHLSRYGMNRSASLLTGIGHYSRFVDPFGGKIVQGAQALGAHMGSFGQAGLRGAEHSFGALFRGAGSEGARYVGGSRMAMTGARLGGLAGRMGATFGMAALFEGVIQGGRYMYEGAAHEQEGIQFGQAMGYHPGTGLASTQQLRSFGAGGFQGLKNDFGLDAQGVTGVASQLSGAGEFSDIQDISKVRARLRERLETLKKLENETGLAIQESTTMVKQLSQTLGISFDAGAGAVSSTVAMASLSTMDAGSLQQAGMGGVAQGLGFSPFVNKGSMYQGTMERVTALQQLYDRNQINRTDVDAVGGVAAATTGVEAQILQAIKSSPGLASMFMTKSGDGFVSNVEGFLNTGGDQTTLDTMRKMELLKQGITKFGGKEIDQSKLQQEMIQMQNRASAFFGDKEAVNDFVRLLPQIVQSLKNMKDAANRNVLEHHMGVSGATADIYSQLAGAQQGVRASTAAAAQRQAATMALQRAQASGGFGTYYDAFANEMDTMFAFGFDGGTFSGGMREFGRDTARVGRNIGEYFTGSETTNIRNQADLTLAARMMREGNNPDLSPLSSGVGGKGLFSQQDEAIREALYGQLRNTGLIKSRFTVESDTSGGRKEILDRPFYTLGGAMEAVGYDTYIDMEEFDTFVSTARESAGRAHKTMLAHESLINAAVADILATDPNSLNESNLFSTQSNSQKQLALIKKINNYLPAESKIKGDPKTVGRILANHPALKGKSAQLREIFELESADFITTSILDQAAMGEHIKSELNTITGEDASITEALGGLSGSRLFDIGTALQSSPVAEITDIGTQAANRRKIVSEITSLNLTQEAQDFLIQQVLDTSSGDLGELGKTFQGLGQQKVYTNITQPALQSARTRLEGTGVAADLDLNKALSLDRTTRIGEIESYIGGLENTEMTQIQAGKQGAFGIEGILKEYNRLKALDVSKFTPLVAEELGDEASTLKDPVAAKKENIMAMLRKNNRLDLVERTLNNTDVSNISDVQTPLNQFNTSVQNFNEAVNNFTGANGTTPAAKTGNGSTTPQEEEPTGIMKYLHFGY